MVSFASRTESKYKLIFKPFLLDSFYVELNLNLFANEVKYLFIIQRKMS
jgi:hypothetical protein